MVRLTGDRDRRAQRARTARRRRQRVIAVVRAVAVAVLMQQGIRRTKRRPVRMTWTLLSRFSLLPTMAQMAQGPPQAQKK